jgi:hypothetical protein
MMRTKQLFVSAATTVAAVFVIISSYSSSSSNNNNNMSISMVMAGVSAQILSMSKLQELHKELRGDDDRLIRFDVTDETANAQRDICPFIISSLVDTIHRADDLQLRGQAAEVLALCTTSNRANRIDIGDTDHGQIYVALDDLIVKSMETWNSTKAMDRQKETQRAVREEAGKVLAQAAEAVWILSYNNERNVEGFFKAGIIDHFVMALKIVLLYSTGTSIVVKL